PIKEPPDRMGDLLARRAEIVLLKGRPYPGDALLHPADESPTRFSVKRLNKTHHQILDRGRHLDQAWTIQIPTELLLNTEFLLGEWYAQRMVDRGFGSDTEHNAYHCFRPMTSAVAFRIASLLSI
ncbi:hypothetical protein EV363DRAFT_1116693, partial [Boletus edulis]